MASSASSFEKPISMNLLIVIVICWDTHGDVLDTYEGVLGTDGDVLDTDGGVLDTDTDGGVLDTDGGVLCEALLHELADRHRDL